MNIIGTGVDIILMVILGFFSLILMQNSLNWVRRFGMLLLMATSGLAAWLMSGSPLFGVLTISAWIVIPVIHAAFLSRRLLFSSERNLIPGNISAEEFQESLELGRDLRQIGFTMDQDYWLKPSSVEQGYRVFVHQESHTTAAVAVVRHGPAILHYMMFITPSEGNQCWITWDYPLAYGLCIPPQFNVYRCLEARNVSELYEQHKEFLKLNEVDPIGTETMDPAKLLNNLFYSTIHYNINKGLLKSRIQNNQVGYTWMGTFFVTWQVLREVILG
jgi:hypothetical protein